MSSSSWTKPAAAMRSPRRPLPADSAEAEAARENEEQARELAKLEAKRQANEDQIGKVFEGRWFITEWTDPILAFPDFGQLSVSRFYPETGVAVDIFKAIGEWETRLIEAKRKAFREREAEYGGKKIKVRYGALDWSMPLANLLPQLEA